MILILIKILDKLLLNNINMERERKRLNMIYRIELDEDLVEKLFEIVEFDTEPLDESSLVEEAIRILIEESWWNTILLFLLNLNFLITQ